MFRLAARVATMGCPTAAAGGLIATTQYHQLKLSKDDATTKLWRAEEHWQLNLEHKELKMSYAEIRFNSRKLKSPESTYHSYQDDYSGKWHHTCN